MAVEESNAPVLFILSHKLLFRFWNAHDVSQNIISWILRLPEQCLLQLRHPNVLSFKETIEVEERGETVLYLVTEAAEPLTTTLRSLDISNTHREQYLFVGLHQVAAALSFLANDCKLIHGNICAAAVAVTEALDWKLHAFDLTTDYDTFSSAATGYGAPMPDISAASWAVSPQYLPGELAKSDWSAIASGPVWAIDSWGLGCLMHEIFSGTVLNRVEELRDTTSIPKSLLPFYQRLLASQPSRRLNPAKLVESGVLRNELWETLDFLENLSLKDALEKEAFFKKLPSRLTNLPSPVLRRKVLPSLASALEFGGAPPAALSALLSIGDGLPESERETRIVPVLTKLFASPDRGIRRGLLENIASFGSSLPAPLVESQIYPNIQVGFTDTNPYLRELTLKSMAVLGSKLSPRTLNQSLLKHLAKLQVDEEPAIRANTTVLLGNLAPHLSKGTCKKILLNAFGRAVRDPFPPARAAGIKAVMATEKYHAADDVATRILPMIGPLCVDSIGEVRSAALQCISHYLMSLQTNHEEIERRIASGGASTASIPTATTRMTTAEAGTTTNGEMEMSEPSNGLLTGLGWAVTSLVSKGGVAPAVASASNAGNAASGNLNEKVRASSDLGGATNESRIDSKYAMESASSRSDEHCREASVLSPENEQHPGGNTKDSDGWDFDEGSGNDPFESLMDDAAIEMEARKKLSSLTLSARRSPGMRQAKGVSMSSGGARASLSMSSKKPGLTLNREEKRNTDRGSRGGRGMKLGTGDGGARLGVARVNLNDADFEDW